MTYFLIFAISFALTCVMVKPSMWIAQKVGAIDMPGGRHVHTHPVPRLGGFAMFCGIAVSLLFFCALLVSMGYDLLSNSEFVKYVGIAAGITVIFIVGVIDDIVHLNPKAKFFGQLVAAAIVCSTGTEITSIEGLGFEFGALAWPVTVLYLVSFANIINLIDGLDGLAAGVSAICAAAFTVLSLANGAVLAASMSVALLGACLGFLIFNFYPAKLFMGDCGSLTLGFMLGVVSLVGILRVSAFTALAIPVAVAGVPVLDTFAAIVRRLREHRPIDSPDKSHLHHALLRSGASQKQVVLTIYGLSTIFALSGVLIASAPFPVRILAVVVDLAIAAALIIKLGLFGPIVKRYYPVDTEDEDK